MSGEDKPGQLKLGWDLPGGLAIELTLDEGRGPPGGRRCGSCSLCCRLLAVDTLGKPAGVKCRYSRQQAKGCCSVYQGPIMPVACKTWSCRWLIENTITVPRPDRSHYVIDVLPDYVRAFNPDGSHIDVPCLQIWVDPAFPNAFRDPKLLGWIERNAQETGMAALIRYGQIGNCILLVPPPLTDGEWFEHHGVAGSGAGVGLWNNIP